MPGGIIPERVARPSRRPRPDHRRNGLTPGAAGSPHSRSNFGNDRSRVDCLVEPSAPWQYPPAANAADHRVGGSAFDPKTQAMAVVARRFERNAAPSPATPLIIRDQDAVACTTGVRHGARVTRGECSGDASGTDATDQLLPRTKSRPV